MCGHPQGELLPHPHPKGKLGILVVLLRNRHHGKGHAATTIPAGTVMTRTLTSCYRRIVEATPVILCWIDYDAIPPCLRNALVCERLG